MAPGQQVRTFAFVLVVRQVPGRALLLGGQLGFELLDPGLECGNDIAHRQADGNLLSRPRRTNPAEKRLAIARCVCAFVSKKFSRNLVSRP